VSKGPPPSPIRQWITKQARYREPVWQRRNPPQVLSNGDAFLGTKGTKRVASITTEKGRGIGQLCSRSRLQSFLSILQSIANPAVPGQRLLQRSSQSPNESTFIKKPLGLCALLRRIFSKVTTRARRFAGAFHQGEPSKSEWRRLCGQLFKLLFRAARLPFALQPQ